MRALLILAALVSPCRAFDGQEAARRIGGLLSQASLPEVQALLVKAVSQPAPPPPSVFPAGLWDTLSAPGPQATAWLALRYPDLTAPEVRELPFAQADVIMGAAAARGLTGLDVFSDRALRGPHVFYLSDETLSRLFQKYDLRALTIAEGVDVHGKPFRMEGILAGAGKVVMLYDRDKFHFANPYYEDFHYQGDSLIIYTILGDGDLSITGLKVDAAIIHPRITRVRKTAPDRMHVDTSWIGQDQPLWPVKIR